MVGFLDDATARAECIAERSFLRSLAGGCRVPVGVHCTSAVGEGGEVTVTLKGRVWSTDGAVEFLGAKAGIAADAAALGEGVAAAVKEAAGECCPVRTLPARAARVLVVRTASPDANVPDNVLPVSVCVVCEQMPLGGLTLYRLWPTSRSGGESM